MQTANITLRHPPCDSTMDSYLGDFHQYRQRREVKPGSPIERPRINQSLNVRHKSSPVSAGVSLATIRSLSRRGRFPTKGNYLPLSMTNDMTHFINYRLSSLDSDSEKSPSSIIVDHRNNQRVEVIMLTYRTKTDQTPLFEIPLSGAIIVARTCSGSGPCIYLTATTGTFEFQCPRSGRHQAYDYHFWESQMRYLAVKIILPQDLFATTSNDPVGEGSFAQVFSATHKTTGRSVVIKRIPKHKLANLPENYTSAADTEIDVLRRIYHPYIVEFQTAFEDDLAYFIVLERLRGGNVYEWLRSHKIYTEKQAREAMFRVLSAVGALEQQNIVHRDLKLENLVLEIPNDPTSIKLIDFGLAAFLNTPRMSMYCGSPGFVAPEIIAKHPFTCRADMFSVGVFLYSVLCGDFPFHSEGETPSHTLARNERCEVSFVAPQWRTVSSGAKDLIGRLLTKDPSTRFSAVQAMSHSWMAGPIPKHQFVQNSGFFESLRSPHPIQSKTVNNNRKLNSVYPFILSSNCNLPNAPPSSIDSLSSLAAVPDRPHLAVVTRFSLLGCQSINELTPGDFVGRRFDLTSIHDQPSTFPLVIIANPGLHRVDHISDGDGTPGNQGYEDLRFSHTEWGSIHSPDSKSTSHISRHPSTNAQLSPPNLGLHGVVAGDDVFANSLDLLLVSDDRVKHKATSARSTHHYNRQQNKKCFQKPSQQSSSVHMKDLIHRRAYDTPYDHHIDGQHSLLPCENNEEIFEMGSPEINKLLRMSAISNVFMNIDNRDRPGIFFRKQ